VTYKENTRSIKNTPAVALIKALPGCRVTVFDPATQASTDWHPRLTVAQDALAACDGADALAIMTPWPQFRELQPKDIVSRLRGRVVIDPFSMLDRAAAVAAGLDQVVLGAPPAHTPEGNAE
jgi:UDPglucose 6-dehydrogenase